MAAFAVLNFLESRNLDEAAFSDQRPVPTLFVMSQEEEKEKEQKARIEKERQDIPLNPIGLSKHIAYSSRFDEKICMDVKHRKTDYSKEIEEIKNETRSIVLDIANTNPSDQKLQAAIPELMKQLDAIKPREENSNGFSFQIADETAFKAAFWNCVNVLEQVGKAAIPNLVKEMEDEETFALAACTLGRLGDARAIPNLLYYMFDILFKEGIGEIFARQGSKDEWMAVLKEIANKDNHGSYGVYHAFACIPDPEVMPILVKAMLDGRSGADAALGARLGQCIKVMEVDQFEAQLRSAFEQVMKEKRKNPKTRNLMKIAQLRIKAGKRKDRLAQEKDILLDSKPRPPKREMIHQCARRKINA
jgi:hypothetical protein